MSPFLFLVICGWLGHATPTQHTRLDNERLQRNLHVGFEGQYRAKKQGIRHIPCAMTRKKAELGGAGGR
ncbi:MAG: hypothetical protein R3C53_22600 [Pirellulaceae bacterium]